MIKKEFKEYIKIEIGRGIKGYVKRKILPSCNAIYMIRKLQYYYKKNFIYNLLSKYYAYRLVIKYGICIRPDITIGLGLKIPHPTSIVIGVNKIGKNCTIYQQTTIGSAHVGDVKKKLQPELGDNVTLFAGSKIIGNINVANGTTVGANAVVTKSTEKNSTYVGVPARKL